MLQTAESAGKVKAPKARAKDELWNPARSGDWSVDNSVGRQAADALIMRMQNDSNPTLLGHTAKAIMEQGVYDGVEVGFFQRIAERLRN